MEASFVHQKETCRRGIAQEQAKIEAAHKKIKFFEDWLIDLMDAAKQEPWFGEAND